jgi:hypothetical protein
MSSRRETVETNDYGDTPVFTLSPIVRSGATMLGWGQRAREHRVSLRDLDRALWQWSSEQASQ